MVNQSFHAIQDSNSINHAATPPWSIDPLEQIESDKPEEACGVYGIYGSQVDASKLVYFGLFALQHRGQESAGIATFQQGKCFMHKDMGLVTQVFDDNILHQLPGSIGVGHTRYSTTGSSRIVNAQPVIVETSAGSIALAHNGNLVNTVELREKVLQQGSKLESSTDSELIAHHIAQALEKTNDITSAVSQACQDFEGAFSLVLGTSQGMMGIRDPHGIRPLVLGTLKSKGVNGEAQYVLSSETCGLDIIGATYVRDVEPGELVWIDDRGLQSVHWSPGVEPKLCIFEMIYFARPDSHMHTESLYSYRLRLGKHLAQESQVDADIVIAVPDSGVPAAIGYSQESGIPYAEGLIKNRYVGRTFIQPTQQMREQGIRMKLNPLPDVLNGKRIIIIDDSIVRGTTSSKIVRALREAGATEVHMRISSPPVTHPCFYGIDTDTQEQLIAATKTIEEIAQQINVDSLKFLSWEGMLEATGENTKHFCSACFTGQYPIEIPSQLKRSKLMLEATPS